MQSISEVSAEARCRLRRRFLSVREKITATMPQVSVALSEVVCKWLAVRNFGCVGIYMPFRGEPDIREAVRVVQVSGAVLTAAFPVVDDKKARRMHYVAVDEDTGYQTGAYGIAQPVGGRAVVPDVIFSPCVAVTPFGARLGNGGGYFDRYLAELALENIHPVTVAVAYEATVTEEFEALSHDVAFEWIATEAGVRRAHLTLIEPGKRIGENND